MHPLAGDTYSTSHHRFPPEIISYNVWLYHRFNLSRRDIEDLLAERGNRRMKTFFYEDE